MRKILTKLMLIAAVVGISLPGFATENDKQIYKKVDALMKKMGRKDRAIGFAVFLDMLERLTEEGDFRA